MTSCIIMTYAPRAIIISRNCACETATAQCTSFPVFPSKRVTHLSADWYSSKIVLDVCQITGYLLSKSTMSG